jgi:hypothetical protein
MRGLPVVRGAFSLFCRRPRGHLADGMFMRCRSDRPLGHSAPRYRSDLCNHPHQDRVSAPEELADRPDQFVVDRTIARDDLFTEEVLVAVAEVRDLSTSFGDQ